VTALLRSRRIHRVAIDLALAAFVWWVTIAQWGSQGFGQFAATAREPDGLGFLLVLTASLPVLAWRRNPLGVLLLTGVTSVGFVTLEYGVLVYLGPAVALYGLAVSRAERDVRVPIGIAFAVAAFAASSVLQFVLLDADGGALTVGALIWIAAWLVGDRVRERSHRLAERRGRTVAEERTHIARELHDSAGHAINVILVQAGAARVLAERDPERSRESLETVEAVARETLGEIDRLVGALREGEGDGTGTAPLPGLDALGALVQRHRDAGLAVTTDIRGSRGALGGAADRAAYRIVQESLTNAARHGHGSAAVTIDYRADRLDLMVTNPVDQGASPANGGGRGIVGMRERAELLGGALQAGRRGDASFVVRASLPYAGEAGG
jgi:signal transduction histidine kinase